MTCRFSVEALRREQTPVDNLFLSEYLPDADGTDLKVYLYGLMQCRYPSMGDTSISDALGLTADAVTASFAHWQAKGLCRIVSEDPLTVEYLDVTVGSGTETPAKYGDLVKKINLLTAPRQFGMRELGHVYDWVEVYGLDAGAILELISYCMEMKGRRVSINYISAVAQSWADEGIRTMADAQAFIQNYRLRQGGAAAILKSWSKRRKPTQDELRLYEKWTTEWGFTEEAILALLPRLTVTGSPNFQYLDELLDLERQRGNTTEESISREDTAQASVRNFSKLLFERAGISHPATTLQCDQIAMFLNEYHMSPELLLFAAEQAKTASEPFGKIKQLLGEWLGAGITEVDKAKAFMADHQGSAGKSAAAKPRKGTGSRGGYAGSDVSDEELDRLMKSFMEEI